MNSSERTVSFDILRIISALSIIIMHITTDRFYSLPLGSREWTVNASINSLFHFGVPIFVMISGALFLNPHKEISIKRLYVHSILRLVIVLFVWNCFYGIYDFLQYKAGLKFLVWEIADGRNHLWFLPMIIGLYVLQPILHRWITNASEKEIHYFLAVFFAVQIIWETLETLQISDFITLISKYRNIPMMCSYIGYFVIGSAVIHKGLFIQRKKLIYICGAAGMILSPFAISLHSNIKGMPMASTVDSFSILTFFYSIAVFCLVMDLSGKKHFGTKAAALITNTGKDTFGLYLCHMGIIEIISPLREWYYSMPSLLGVPVYAIVIFLIGICLSAILRRIPLVGRYIC